MIPILGILGQIIKFSEVGFVKEDRNRLSRGKKIVARNQLLAIGPLFVANNQILKLFRKRFLGSVPNVRLPGLDQLPLDHNRSQY